MISSLDVRDQKMVVHLGGPHPEEDPDLPFDEDLVHLFDVVDPQEGEVDLLGGGLNITVLYGNLKIKVVINVVIVFLNFSLSLVH